MSTDSCLTLFSHSEEQTLGIGRYLGTKARAGDVFALQGVLGAGKTVFARGFADGLSVPDSITSPTYPIIQEYGGRLPFYHMDFYRLRSTEDAIETGALELLGNDGVALVEWPERADAFFSGNTVRVALGIEEDGSRRIVISCEAREVFARFDPTGLETAFGRH